MKALLAVLLIATLLLPDCAGEKPAKEIVIPSSLSSTDVMKQIYSDNPSSFILGESLAISDLPDGAWEEGFAEGYRDPFGGGWYIKRDGSPVKKSYEYDLVLIFKVLKYESTEFAERSYDGIGEAYGFHNLTYRNIPFKTGVKPASEYGGESLWGVSNVYFYVVHSGCFIIHIEGHDDIARDALDRTIDTFGV